MMHATPPDASEWLSWDPDDRQVEPPCSVVDDPRSFELLDETVEVVEARSESDRGAGGAGVPHAVFEGATFRQDVLSVLLDVRRHHCTLTDNADSLLVKWGTDCTPSARNPKRLTGSGVPYRRTGTVRLLQSLAVLHSASWSASILTIVTLKRGGRVCRSSTKKPRTTTRRGDRRCPPRSWNASSPGACRSLHSPGPGGLRGALSVRPWWRVRCSTSLSFH